LLAEVLKLKLVHQTAIPISFKTGVGIFLWSEIADVTVSGYTTRHGWQSNSANASEKGQPPIVGQGAVFCNTSHPQTKDAESS